jgi:hypothetical protein
LGARLASLYFVSGADAVASLTSGFAALGREVSQTSEGAKLRQVICGTRVALNGEATWSALHIGEGASSASPSPILDYLRNDVALLLADDLEGVLSMMPIPPEARASVFTESPQRVSFLDFLVGYWAFSKEVVAAVEALARSAQPFGAEARPGAEQSAGLDGSLLR